MASQMVSFKTQANPQITGVKDVEPQELFEKRDQVVIIDVRRPEEFTGELGHVEGSQLVVLDTIPQRLSELPKDKTVVFVCRSGNRSGQAAGYAQEHGFTDVYNMRGGMLLWNQLNLSVAGRNEF